MGRLLIISNRLPINISKHKNQFILERSVGGLATGIGSIYKSQESLWIGWPGYSAQKTKKEEKDRIITALVKENCHPVFLTSFDIKQYYSGFCNNTIWPLFHYFPLYVKYEENYWKYYKKVNEKFLDAVLDVAESGDTFWIHDYQLMLLPEMLREKLPEAKIGFFLHVPFPSYEIFRLLPWRSEILLGILGADLVGFHTYDYVRHFLSSVRRILGYDYSLSEIQTGERIIKAELFPMGIDYDRFFKAASSPQIKKEVARIFKKPEKQKIILSFDRLDYTKGIPLRLEAFDTFLNRKPEYHGKVILYLVAVPSRSNVNQYQTLKKQIDELVGRINGKYATTDWIPIRYFSHYIPFKTLIALYSLADVGLVTPLRDGMNLMAKEFIASKVDSTGILILSEMAGASQELGEAIIVNPNNKEALVNAIEKALTTTKEEQKKQNRAMQKRLKRYDINRWIEDYLSSLDKAWVAQQANMSRVITPEAIKELIERYTLSTKRLILLDYDGTLVPFANTPEEAKPTHEVLHLLKQLTEDISNEVVIISGRKHETLIDWFRSLNIGFIGEHGAWIMERSGEVHLPEAFSNGLKQNVMPLLELYSDRTPGSFIEEKAFSLVWHYRMAEPTLGFLRANQLKDDLSGLTANLGLAVVEGNKVIEVKNATINKGSAAQLWLNGKWDFIMAIGDDKTDEDLFEALPATAFSIKIGVGSTKARFNLSTQDKVLPLLWRCANSKKRVA
jgi:trehalose 6-phosphate synthase/phosphatase